MPTERKLALGLLVSLGINLFLAGVLGGQFGRDDRRPRAVPSLEKREHAHKSEREKKPKSGKLAQQGSHKTDPHRGAPGRAEHHGRAGHLPADGPSDLVLLRQMIQIMGGPTDPRIARLREERRSEIRRIRAEMQAAHKRVRDALTSEKSDEAELQEALKNLRKTAFEAQARAQEGILTLARLMTAEERARLRNLPRGKGGEPKGPKELLGPEELPAP